MDTGVALLPHTVLHVAVSLDGATTGFEPDQGAFYDLAARWNEDVTLVGADTILAQEAMLADGRPGPGADPEGPLLAVVDSRARVSEWAALRAAGHWRDVVRLAGDRPGARVDLRRTLAGMARRGTRMVRIDSGGGLAGALLADGLVDEISLLVHPVLVGQDGRRWYGSVAPPAARLQPLEHQCLDGGLVWLRYRMTGSRSPP